MESAATAIPALLQGRLDVVPGPVSAAIFNAINRGARLRIVGDKGAYRGTDCSHNAFVVSVAGTAGEDPPVLERVSTAKEHFNQFFMDRALRHHGYDPANIEMYHVPQAAEYDAIMAARLDAAFMGEPWLTRVRQGGAEIWTPTNSIFDGYQYSVLLFGPRLLDDEPDVGERFAVAMLQGLRSYNEGKTAQNLDVMTDMLGHDRDELRQVCWPTMSTDGSVNIASLMEFQEWALARGELDAIIEPGQFWDGRFVDHANRVLGASD